MRRIATGLAVGIVLGLTAPAAGELRFPVHDDALVEQAEVIALGSLRPETVELVPHLRGDGSRSWEYHVILVIDQYIKGQREEVEIPIVLEYGFEARVGSLWREDFLRLGPAEREALRGQPIEIRALDWLWPVAPDASQPHLWFLRTMSHEWIGRRQPSTGWLGVRDPEALQPPELLSYFQAYLAQDPEAAVAEQARRNAAVQERAQEYLDHRRARRLAGLPDPRERVAALLPLLELPPGRARHEAHQGIVAAGPAAGPLLVPLFERRPELRVEVVRLWGEIGDRQATPRLIQLLQEVNAFWARWDLPPGWWNRREELGLPQELFGSYHLLHEVLVALRRLGDPRAREAVEATLRGWMDAPESSQIVSACQAYLQEVDLPARQQLQQ